MEKEITFPWVILRKNRGLKVFGLTQADLILVIWNLTFAGPIQVYATRSPTDIGRSRASSYLENGWEVEQNPFHKFCSNECYWWNLVIGRQSVMLLLFVSWRPSNDSFLRYRDLKLVFTRHSFSAISAEHCAETPTSRCSLLHMIVL